MATGTLSAREKAAILMIALGKEASSKVYKYLGTEDIEKLTLSITSIDSIDADLRDDVLAEFHEICVAQKYVTDGGIEYARELLISSVGEERADELLSKLSASLQVRPFDFVRRSDSAQVLNFIQGEHPQTIALVLSYLDPRQAALILGSLAPEIQAKVVQRIAKMNVASPEYVREAERVLERKLTSVDLAENMIVGGIGCIVDIINSVDRSTEKAILESIEIEDAELAEEIHRRLFVFEDITRLSNVALQRTLKEVDNDILTIALKGASDDIAKKIYANITKHLQDILKENMEFMGPVRVRDVEEAQQKIVNVIRRLEEAGEIEVVRGAEDEVIV